jgi:hypothetical protein
MGWGIGSARGLLRGRYGVSFWFWGFLRHGGERGRTRDHTKKLLELQKKKRRRRRRRRKKKDEKR